MQRLYSMFPNGWPGKGLLVLRLASGSYLLVDGASLVTGALRTGATAFVIAAILGLLQILGLWTPLVAILAILTEMWILFAEGGNFQMEVLLIFVNLAIAMLGPGCWSIDSILFGRRRLNLSNQ